MRDRENLILLLRERLLDLGELGTPSDGAVNLSHGGAVRGQAVGEAIAKVPRAKHQGVLARLDEVGGYEVPAQGAGARDDEGLRGWVGCLEELAEHGEGLAEGGDEAGADMALTGR
jgi:hypothetical protein